MKCDRKVVGFEILIEFNFILGNMAFGVERVEEGIVGRHSGMQMLIDSHLGQ
jgi:hypothetical protein